MSPYLEWGVAGVALPGFSESGDRHIFQTFEGGALVAVMDGLGHGPEAAAAALQACSVLQMNAGENVISLIRRCHSALKETRGVTISLASFSFRDALMTWMGVGNVQGIFVRGDRERNDREEALLLRSGVVGSHLPALQAAVLPVSPGDSLAFATDGVESGFDYSSIRCSPPGRAAETILSRHMKGRDDALVLVARYMESKL
ncbi:MAG TPA: SpoIIE family protein phosphatase [Candidatus Aquilonibacter sp.]|nr:SpoIIE family protein phosphatase [Candidatus Aquilonibacter sp.]